MYDVRSMYSITQHYVYESFSGYKRKMKILFLTTILFFVKYRLPSPLSSKHGGNTSSIPLPGSIATPSNNGSVFLGPKKSTASTEKQSKPGFGIGSNGPTHLYPSAGKLEYITLYYIGLLSRLLENYLLHILHNTLRVLWEHWGLHSMYMAHRHNNTEKPVLQHEGIYPRIFSSLYIHTMHTLTIHVDERQYRYMYIISHILYEKPKHSHCLLHPQFFFVQRKQIWVYYLMSVSTKLFLNKDKLNLKWAHYLFYSIPIPF